MALTQNPLRQLAVSAGAAGASSAINTKTYTKGVVEVSGINGDTVKIQGRLTPAGGWYDLGIENVLSTGTVSTTITADGLYQVNVNALAEVRSNISSYSSGDLNINIRLTDV